MATYVYRRNHRSDPRIGDETAVGGPHWSLWRNALLPAGALAPGDRVVLLDHWRGDDRLSWELEVDRAEHLRYGTKAEAIQCIARAFDLTEVRVAEDGYIAAKGDGPGVLLAWSGRPVRRLDLPRPLGLSVARHGWVAVDDAAALRWWDADAADLDVGSHAADPAQHHPDTVTAAADDAMHDAPDDDHATVPADVDSSSPRGVAKRGSPRLTTRVSP
jgi:hypothetical protein